MASTSESKKFADRLSDLLNEARGKKEDYRIIARALGISTGALSNYANDVQQANLTTVARIADYFHVSTDWLLGRTDDPSMKPSAVDELGLSPEAVWRLQTYRSGAGETWGFLDQLLSNRHIYRLIDDLCAHYYASRAKNLYDTLFTQVFGSAGENGCFVADKELLRRFYAAVPEAADRAQGLTPTERHYLKQICREKNLVDTDQGISLTIGDSRVEFSTKDMTAHCASRDFTQFIHLLEKPEEAHISKNFTPLLAALEQLMKGSD